ncbi:MFS transporter [uncultured Corynebacterium sp.]|uniref:MFS transporter n=1 Tax=uncultured Corynebacterium sp. TaxID=159447 RepID=UPI0025FE3E2C|nr:MFS transporter [uncultured Corynebacterium sp.]
MPTVRQGARRIPSAVAFIAALAVLLTSSNLRSPVSTFPPIADQVADGLEASGLFIGLVGMAPTAMFAVAAILSGPMAKALSFRAVISTAMVLATAGFGLRTIASNELPFLAGTMIGLVGVGITNTLLPAVIKDYFPFKLTVMSIAYMAVGQVSMATASVAAVPLAELGGWRVAIGVWAIPPLLALLCWGVLVFAVTPGTASQRGGEMLRQAHPRKLMGVINNKNNESRGAYSHIWKNPVSWGIVVMFAMTSSISYCFITWAPKIIVESGGSAQLGGVIGGVFAIVGTASSFLVPWMTSRFERGAAAVTILSCSCMFVALLMVITDPMRLPVVWISLVSLGCSTFPLGLMLIATRTREPKAAAVLSSGAQGIGYTVACIGPFGFGALYDATASWTTGLSVLVGFNVVLLGAGLVASRRVFVDDR